MNIENREFNPILEETKKQLEQTASKYEKLPATPENEIKKAASILALAKKFTNEKHFSPEEMQELIENIY